MAEKVVTLTPNPALDLWLTTSSFRAGPKLRTSRPRSDPGGGGINVSRVIHRLGGETLALYAAGGRRGDEIEDGLKREGIDAERCGIEGDTREDISVCEEESGKVLRFVTPGPELQRHEVDRLLDMLERAATGASLVVGSGSLPQGAGEDFWARAATRGKRAGARFVLDSHDAIDAALETGVYCFRENRDAISGIAGHDVGWPDETAAWAEKRVEAGAAEIVIVTEGDEGALLVTRDVKLLQRPPEVDPRSAIGAGDSFVAGLCLAWARQEGLEESLRAAVATAAATLLTPGTELCRQQDAARLLADMGELRRL
ncbi:1-phosphofructokinase family hexose kinase [Rhodovulum sp. 12E13]|uniref:1-phosphofructokinase family hexose kinase n=1 Tax=Rhodovulum sp. 12E13 TaxID=2203891 RepID=UPI001314ED27|nr:1-phosphofructokinase family hexose kinase [Rhodovulum sp. 12E13]